MEAREFSRALQDFRKLEAQILGVSPDPLESHKKFIIKQNLAVTLLSDTAHSVMEDYGVWQKKKMYGKEFWGVMRTTFLIDPDGRICYAWRNVRVKGHVQEVLAKLKELQSRWGGQGNEN